MDFLLGVSDGAIFIGILLHLTFRIIITMICVNRARNLNRSTLNWGAFGFVFPIIAIIVIMFMKYKVSWPYSKDRVN